MLNFVNNGTDEEILKSLPLEGASDELIKAMGRQGLVQKEVQVRTENGVITRKQWVRASQDQPADKPMKKPEEKKPEKVSKTEKTGDHITAKSKDELWSELKSKGFEVDSADKHSPQDTITLYKNKQEFTATFNKYSDGGCEVINLKPVGSNSDKKQPQQEQTEVESSETPVSKLKAGDSFDLVIHGDSQGTVKITSITEGHTDGPISFANYHIKGTLNGKPYDETVSQNFSPHKVVKKETSSSDNQKKSSDSKNDSKKSDSTTDDRLDVLDQIEKVSGTGKFSETAKKHGITWENSSSDIVNNTRAGFALVQAVKSGKLSLDDLKAKNDAKISTPKDKASLLQMLQSGTSREDIMSQAEKDGVTWKHSDHPGINWMRASMAMTGTSTKGVKEEKSSIPEVTIDTKSLDLSGDFYNVTETAKEFDLGVQVALCKKLGLDPNKFTVIQPEDANDTDSFDKFSSAVSKQIKPKDLDTMEFDDNDPDADGVGYQMYKKFSLNGKTCVALYDEGMVSYMIPNEVYSAKSSNNSVIGSDYTKLTTDAEAGTPEGEAHNMMVGRLKSKLYGKTPTASDIKGAAASLATATKHSLIMSGRKEDIEHNTTMLNQFNKLAGNNYTMTHEDVLKDVLSSQSGASMEEKGSAVNKIMNEGSHTSYYNGGDGSVFTSADDGSGVTIQPTARGNFKVSFTYADGASRKETYDKIDAVKTAAEKFMKSN